MDKGVQHEIDLQVQTEDNSAASVKHKSTTKLCSFQFFKLFNLVPFLPVGMSGRQNLVFYFSI